ncbi:AMP-binding enzyme [Nocardia nova SH22a]|uniref:AMP-binding enzyme n=1 Tax=Nocardia nova SH22a TaxID=1415166 RepID=W5TGV1_9NOCA|nr:AMP-binding protein [Nocardia nova]AHH18369.1 AMP-binding enzyme [Nocardia nova SH22a]
MTLSGVLGRAATHFGDRCAIVSDDKSLVYRDLHRHATELASALREGGVGQGDIVGVHLARSIEATVAIHAVLAAGAVVAPLEPNDPAPRTFAIVDSAAISHILTDGNGVQGLGVREMSSTPMPFGLRLAATGATPPPQARQAAYLLSTSGSTGTPKGVLLSDESVLHFVRWAADRTGLTATDRIAAQSALTFDLSTFDLFATASTGAAQVVLPDWLKAFPPDLTVWLETNAITGIYAVPSLLQGIARHVLRSGTDRPSALRTIIYAGEPYPAQALAELTQALPAADVHNFYGPTETNVCTASFISRDWQPGQAVSIGTALDGMYAVPVDAELVACDEGELVVAGPQLLTGYLSAGALTDPTVRVRYPDGVVRRSYRTGDLARRGPDDRLYLLGRADSQVKRRGYRIELDGIAAIASGVGGAYAAAAVATGAQARITLFLDPRDGDAESCRRRVADALRSQLPATHQPDEIVCLTPFPVNTRGKVDRSRLARIAAADRSGAGEFAVAGEINH